MNGSGDLRRRVIRLAAGLAAGLAAAAGVVWGQADALGVVAGSLITVANFAVLDLAAGRVLAGAAGPVRRGRRVLWIGASTARLGVVVLAVGLAWLWGGVGPRGLLVSLAIVPVTVVAAGLARVRAA